MRDERLFVNVTEHTYAGQDCDFGNGEPYSGYSHNVIHIDSIGPAYFAKDGKGYTSHMVSGVDICRSSIPPFGCHCLFFVVVRFSEGGTFGRTEGRYEFPYVTINREDAVEWARKNKARIKQDHSGYFDKFEGISVAEVEYCSEEAVPEKRFFSYDEDIPDGYGNR